MAVSLGFFLFAYICLVFEITHRICMMQCNPMPGPGMYHGDMGDIRFSGSHVENTGSVRERRDGLSTRQIRFDPSYLDFHEQPVGMPRIKTVTIINPSTEQSLQLQSISGSTVHFHASFFQAKIVQPLGNTTFEIVFLARLVGNAENTLFIHTSKGVYPYQVFGSGSPNPYRLRPFLGAKVPLNYSFTSLINMHNPYSSPLQVVEMYSSGGDLHLELPSGLEKAPQKHWEIPPYETKALMRVSFAGRYANNYTAFIRIKTSNPSPFSEFLILPVEVEVTAVPGLFASVDLLDFGTLRTMDEPKAVGVYILNSGSKQAHITSVAVEPSNTAVVVTFNPIILKPGSKYLKIATVTYSAYHVKRSKQMSGKIIIKTTSKVSSRLELPYQANVLQGTIAYSVSKTRFYVGQSPFVPVLRELPITNTFSFTMVIYEATFPQEVENIFKVVNLSKPAMISSQTTASPFYLEFLANASDLSFSTILRVYTNASIFTIPIHCYNGKLKYVVESLEEDVVDYGTVGTGENRTKLMRIYNNNPIEVTISKITCTVEYASIRLLEVRPKDSKNSTSIKSRPLEHDKVSVKPDYVAVFSVEVNVPKKPGRYTGEFEITTDFEMLHIPIYFKAMDGKVFPSPKIVNFQPCFPGRIEQSSLSLTSTFLQPLKLLSVTPEPPDPQFDFELNKTEPLESNDIIGSVIFNPLQGCKDNCYVGLGTSNAAMATKWLKTLTLPHDVVDIDSHYVEKLQRAYDSLKRTGKNRINTTLVIDTDLAQGIRVMATATLTWPSLAPDKPIKFPLTQIGNYSIKHFCLENPADVPVVVQIVSLSKYPKLQGLLDIVAERFGVDVFDLEEIDSVFSLPNVETGKVNNTNTSSSLGVTPVVQGVLGVAPAPSTYVTILEPRSKTHLPLQFSPVDDKMHSSIILIRNNLTVLDAVTVQGQGAKGEFMLNSKLPGAHSTLLFELRSSHLSDCHKPSSRSHSQPPLSVKKVLTATNPGQLAIFVSSLSINGRECEGYGFKILNCKSFILNPNSSRKIEIAFTPDFTMSRVTRRLEVKTTFGPVMVFTLVATIPPHILPLCAAAMGHSSWEPVLQLFTVVVMVIMFVGVVVAAYSEARSILGISLPTANLLLNCEERGQVFDLKAIAGVKPKTSKEERQVNVRKPRRDLKDSRTSDRQHGESPSGASNSINNNVNKNSPGTRQDKNKNTKSPPSDNSNKSNKSPVSDTRPYPYSHEPKIRHKEPSRNTVDSTIKRDYKPAVAEIEELKQSIASVQEMESETSMNFVKDFKDVKSKSKKKSKAFNRREEPRNKTKDKNSARRQADYYDVGCSDESGNEGETDRVSLGLRLDVPTEKSPQRFDTSNKGTNDKTKARKNQVSPSESKGKKHDNQTAGKPKSHDLNAKAKERVGAIQAESRESPHDIAAKVMSHLRLEKSLQTSTRDNSFDEGEGKRKAFDKTLNRLSDSPPLVSPTNLSGSSRSSSYSSIVSSDGSSSGSDQGKGGSLTKALKQRLKSSRSMPLGDQAASIGFRSMKPSYHPFSLSSVKKTPWSTSADSALAPGSRSPTIQRPSASHFSPIPSTSLFESTPFNSLANSEDPRASPKIDRPLDLSAFGVSGASGDVGRSRPSVWSSPSSENPHSLFSVPPPFESDDKQVPRANNWVNFLGTDNTSPTALNFKSVAEIWDSGNMPTTDGWSHCAPSFPGENKEGEPDPVDALFSAVSPDWSGVDTHENTSFVAQETWGPAPVPNIWGDQYPIPTSGATSTNESLTFNSSLEAPEPESPGGTFDTMSGYSTAEIWKQPWSSSKE